ncbi:MAG: ArsA-related P-loop ATPase [Acidimicrobiales bacterium]
MVAGKGGVGRTTVAAALAANGAESGNRVLAIDASGSADLEQVVARNGLTGRFETIRLTTRSALDQYLKIHLKLPLGPSRLGPLANIFDYVSAAAPGVRELLIVGKIGQEARFGQWDEIIVDAPATGHVVELLTAPRSMAELVPTGPLAQQTGWLGEVLRAPTTSVVMVAIPEELPVTETGELLTRIRTETDTAVTDLVVNKTPVPIDRDGRAEADRLIAAGRATSAVLELARSRDTLAAAQSDRIDALGLRRITALERYDEPVDAVRRALHSVPVEPGR